MSGLCLKLNPANYSIWHFRRQCLDEIITNDNIAQIIQQDLELAAGLGGANPKNYQIWYHRRALLESAAKRNGPDNCMATYAPTELDYVATVLDEDSKNYHAWSHRQWVVRTANDPSLWEKELGFGELSGVFFLCNARHFLVISPNRSRYFYCCFQSYSSFPDSERSTQ